jgi:hypothetical protein
MDYASHAITVQIAASLRVERGFAPCSAAIIVELVSPYGSVILATQSAVNSSRKVSHLGEA